ncbi:UTP:RNA uridylyltransferase 1 [Phytophthora ramorum]|uniref:UTP:RNA uridylyltransferase 1 n=1 Tax=Phytophthora ramorum TaxID=164328 RepID=UPI00309AE8DC|nr:UTP:RNA uridylyltransferase 1 [Phytophthora ramorum]
MISNVHNLLPVLLIVLVSFLTGIEADSAFSVSSASTETVDSSTEHVAFVKQWTLSGTNTDNNGGDNDDDDDDSSDDGDNNRVDSIKLQVPGRVFISYVSSMPSGVLGYVNVSGDSQSLVEAVKVSSNDDDEELEVKYDTSSSSSSGYLLTEIFLVTSDIVDDVEIESSAEVIIEDGVLIASNSNKELQIKASDSSVVYVSSAAMTLQDLKLELSDSATLQLTTDSISVREDVQFQAHDKSSLTVITSSLTVADLDLDAENSGAICISAQEVSASSYDGQDASKISLPNASSKHTSTGTASCDEASTPSRQPGCVFSSACSSMTTSTSSTSTSTPSATSATSSASSATTTSSSSGVKTSEQNSAAVGLFAFYSLSMALTTSLLLAASLAPVPMAAWPQPPRSPNHNGGRFEPDTGTFQSLGAFGHDSFLGGSGQLSGGLELGGFGLGLSPPPPPASGGLGLGLNQQPPPLPPSSPGLLQQTEAGGALYHLQQQQQLQQQQDFAMGPGSSSGLSSLASLGGLELGAQSRGEFGLGSSSQGLRGPRLSAAEPTGPSISGRRGFDLSDAMLNLDLSGGMLGERGVLGGSGGWGDVSLSSPSPSSASLRDQMNAQMAALYQHPKPPTNDRLMFQQHQRQPLAQSGNDLLGLLNNGNNGNNSGFGGRELYPPPSVNIPGGSMQSPRLGGFPGFPASSPNSNGGHGGLAPTMSPSRGPHSRSSTPSRSRRSPAKSPQLHRENSAPSSMSGGQGNSIHVSPEVTKPNDNIKVQVSLLAEECVVGRVLLVGLFRLGQPTNDKPIFVKQVLFENKLHRNYRFLNTRITFRAPRSPGEFEFRVFEDKSGHSHQPNGKRYSNDDHHDSHHHGKVSYSNVTIARSNRLKVCLEYSHFIDTLRATHDKFQQGVIDGDAGLVLSALLALMRLVDQVETVFLHGHALLGDLLEACLHLLERRAEDIARSFAATETIPHPMETFHGTLRNVLNAVEANTYVRELVADDQLADIARIQRERFCQVSGLYFANDADRCAFWLEHFGFAPIDIAASDLSVDGEGKMLHSSPFVTRALTRWVEREAAVLMPDRTSFRASRQSIYDQLHGEVISKLSFTCELDVFGSSANEFGNEHSDMDMCLVLPEVNTPTVEEKQRILLEVVARLESRPDLFASVDTTRLTARIPIVMFVSRASGIECDLCVENRLAQRNTSLLRAYASADSRVRTLAYVIKRFVKQRRMNCAAEGTLSSYGYLLLLIHYLQRQDPPVLPVLQTLPPNWPDEPREKLPSILCRGPSEELDPSASNGTEGHSGIETYFYDPFAFREPNEKLASLRDFGARNTQSVGELLLGFLRYYGLQFDATRDVVSVRRADAGTVTKDEKRHTSQWRFTTRLSIEDPFEVGYDVAHVLKGSRDKYIRQQFVRAYVLLMDGAIQHQGRSTEEDSQAEQVDDLSVDRIMSIVNDHVLEVPFLQAPPPHPLSPIPMPMPMPHDGF